MKLLHHQGRSRRRRHLGDGDRRSPSQPCKLSSSVHNGDSECMRLVLMWPKSTTKLSSRLSSSKTRSSRARHLRRRRDSVRHCSTVAGDGQDGHGSCMTNLHRYSKDKTYFLHQWNRLPSVQQSSYTLSTTILRRCTVPEQLGCSVWQCLFYSFFESEHRQNIGRGFRRPLRPLCKFVVVS